MPSEGSFDPMISLPGTAARSSELGSRVGLDPQLVQEMLKMGVADARRPIDRLIERLSVPGGADWLVLGLRLPQCGFGEDPEGGLVRGRLSLAALDAAKERCKQAAFTDPDANVRLAATGGYYLTIAAAAVHHNRLITSLPHEELSNAFLDLGAAMQEPWALLLGRAALLLGVA
jgi:hypothetical protein